MKQITIRVDDKEYESWKARSGGNMNGFIRRCVNQEKDTIQESLEYIIDLLEKKVSPGKASEPEPDNPYKNWTIVPNPDGEKEPWYSDEFKEQIIVIKSPRGLEKVIPQSNPLFKQMVK